jgi:hypothetical protein
MENFTIMTRSLIFIYPLIQFFALVIILFIFLRKPKIRNYLWLLLPLIYSLTIVATMIIAFYCKGDLIPWYWAWASFYGWPITLIPFDPEMISYMFGIENHSIVYYGLQFIFLGCIQYSLIGFFLRLFLNRARK